MCRDNGNCAASPGSFLLRRTSKVSTSDPAVIDNGLHSDCNKDCNSLKNIHRKLPFPSPYLTRYDIYAGFALLCCSYLLPVSFLIWSKLSSLVSLFSLAWDLLFTFVSYVFVVVFAKISQNNGLMIINTSRQAAKSSISLHLIQNQYCVNFFIQ